MPFIKKNILGIGLAASCLFSSYWLNESGLYGLTMFGLLPFVIGAVAGWLTHVQSENAVVVAGGLSAVLATTLFLILGWDQSAGLFLAWPIAIPLASFGAWLVYQRFLLVKGA